MNKLSTIFLGLVFLVLYTTLVSGAGGGAGGHNSDSVGDTDNSDTDSTKILHVGYSLELVCNISKSKDENLNLIWFKDNATVPADDRIKMFGNDSLIITSAVMTDVGTYKCEVESDSDRKFEIHVIYLYYKNLPPSVTVLQGDKLSLVCDVEGIPIPTISWKKDDQNLEDVVNMTYTLSPNEKKTPDSMLVIDSAAYTDGGEYVCVIRSYSITYTTPTIVRVKDMYAALWPFLGIVAEVVILVLIILIYEKKRAKADFEESDTDQSPEGKTKAGHTKDSVRQRK